MRRIRAYNLMVLALVLLLSGLCGQLFAQQLHANQPEDLFEMSLEELMEVSIETPGALTATTPRTSPSTATTLTKEDIQRCGARNLDELLDIMVPNLQMIYHPCQHKHLGLRGIISDRDDKFLLLVNGRQMNHKGYMGAFSERDLPMLKDIHHIDVVRGPGSALYGPGALAMVINIVTENAMTFQGTEFTARLGAIEEFYSWEIKHGKKFDKDSGIFLYAGADKYVGADSEDAPMVYGGNTSYPDNTTKVWPAGSVADHILPRDNQPYRGLPRFKVFGQYTNGDFDLWLRWTRGGYDFHAGTRFDFYDPYRGNGYQQATALARYVQSISDSLSVDYTLSFDMFDFEYLHNIRDSSREDEYQGRILARWTPDKHHSLAFGGEWSHEEFGLKSPGFPHSPASDSTSSFLYDPKTEGSRLPRWSTDTPSLLGEWQWKLNDKWTTFLGGRIDWHTFTDPMYSPRLSVVHTPSEADTFKLMASRSARTQLGHQMKLNWDRNGKDSETEQLDAYELRYERQHNRNLWFAGAVFYHDQEVVGWDWAEWEAGPQGDLQTYGFEVEAIYKTKKTMISLSHGYTKLIDFELASGASTMITTEPYGFGNDLAAWSNHISKLNWRYDLDEKWATDGSVYVYWGYPGRKDWAEWQIAPVEQGGRGMTDNWVPGHDTAFGTSVYLNLGLQYELSPNLKIRLDGYNLLGWIDKDINKRLLAFGGRDNGGDYRSHAAAVGISLTYRF
ncbi:MAG: TonB-dependent receptor plug domain-containing protein [Sedimentisphaerales bacterium]